MSGGRRHRWDEDLPEESITESLYDLECDDASLIKQIVDSLESDLENSDPVEFADEVERIADKIGVDLSTECPVCRRLGDCECVEEDRSFTRRVQFQFGKSVPQCGRCCAALSSIMIPRPGFEPPFMLKHMVPVWACAVCHANSMISVLARVPQIGAEGLPGENV